MQALSQVLVVVVVVVVVVVSTNDHFTLNLTFFELAVCHDIHLNFDPTGYHLLTCNTTIERLVSLEDARH